MNSPLDNLLTRLDKVKRQGRGYIACCPAHRDRTPSLSILEADDGRVLVHCFSGCSAADVVAAVGLELKDLFTDSGLSASQKKRLVNARQRRKYEDILRQERTAVQIGRNRLARGETLSPENQERLRLALGRVKKLEGLLNG